ncbi:hypothetical protein [Paenibacillus sp. MBLB4367]|uniref:hypothetical protein n=1 Tax=Paenibacillus sp. MBLB4367 TaxID=3384767 RepID=UPI0039083DFB
MFTIIFYGLVILAVLATIIGITVKPKICWLAGIIWYVASFLGSMSIGLYLLIIPFTLWSLAFAHTFRLIKKPLNTGLFIVIGILLWIVSITIIDDYWLFFPISWLF